MQRDHSGREVVEHLGAGDVKFRSGELQVLGLDGKGSDLEAKRAAGARALARVRVAQQRRHIAGAHAHDGIGEGGEARDHDESRGVEGARDANGEAAGCKVAADHREQPQQVRLRLIAHLLRRPEAFARALGVVMGERQRQHGGDEMLNECDPQQVRVGHVAHLVREHLAQLDRVTKRHSHLVQRLDLISHSGELYGQHHRRHLRLSSQMIDRATAAQTPKEGEARGSHERMAALELNRGRRRERQSRSALRDERLEAIEGRS